MNKQELIDRIAEKTGQTKTAAAVTLDATLEAIQEAIIAGQDVKLKGFGRFFAREYKPREIQAPTHEKIYVEGHLLPCFKAGKAFKEALEGKK